MKYLLLWDKDFCSELLYECIIALKFKDKKSIYKYLHGHKSTNQMFIREHSLKHMLCKIKSRTNTNIEPLEFPNTSAHNAQQS